MRQPTNNRAYEIPINYGSHHRLLPSLLRLDDIQRHVLEKDALPVDKVGEEEEIDVSGESASFHPEMIRKGGRIPRNQRMAGQSETVGPVNTGAIRLEDFLSMAEDYSRDGEFSEIGKQLQEWGANVA